MEDRPLASIRAVLATTAGRWQSMAETLPPDLLARPPLVGEWSALDCLRHLLDTERDVFPMRVRTFLAGQDLAAFNPETQGSRDTGQTPKELAAEFARLRAASLALLDQVTADDLARTVRHSELGPVTLGELLHEWAGHDLMHTVQAERSLMQPFIVACGPWRSYFRDHDVASMTPQA